MSFLRKKVCDRMMYYSKVIYFKLIRYIARVENVVVKKGTFRKWGNEGKTEKSSLVTSAACSPSAGYFQEFRKLPVMTIKA